MSEKVFDLLIINGKIVSPEGIRENYLAVKDGKIVEEGVNPEGLKATRVIDAKGKYVLPGGIDDHVHFRDPGDDLTYKEYATTGSRAAAAGGITTVFDMPNVHPSCLNVKNFELKKKIYEEKCLVNYGLYAFVVEDPELVDPLMDAGCAGFKWDMGTPDNVLPDHHRMPTNAEAAVAFQKIAARDYCVTIHAEDMDLVKFYTAELQKSGRDPKDFMAHEEARPDVVEVSAIARSLVLSDLTGCRINITHLSSKKGLEMIVDAKKKGSKITCEVGPSWYTFSTDDYPKYGGAIRVVPAIHHPEDRDALWEGLVNGDVDMVGTDHAPHSLEEKFERSWWDTLPGTIGVQTSLPLILDRCNKGEISLERVVEVMSEKPAKVWGLYPRKGCLQVGSDADITIVDMDLEWTVTHAEMKSKTQYTPFDGFQLKGKPVTTIVMGQVAYENGEVVGKPGVGVMVNPKKDW